MLLRSDVRVTQQNGTCTGVVKDATGETIIGASVVVKGSTNGTITGIDGDFSLSNVPKGSTIVISFVGYQTQEIKLSLIHISYITSAVFQRGAYFYQRRIFRRVSITDFRVLFCLLYTSPVISRS